MTRRSGVLSVRRCTDEDVPSLLNLADACLYLERDPAGQLVKYLWEEGLALPTTRFVACMDDEPIGIAFGSTRGTTAHLDLLCVDAAWRRRGVGKMLVQTWEAEASSRGATGLVVGGNPVMYAWPGIDMRYTEGISLFLRHGYVHQSTAYNMEVDLRVDHEVGAEKLSLLEASGIRTRRTEPSDRDQVATYLREEWSDTWEIEVANAFPDHVFIALEASRIVGFAVYGVGWPARYGPIGTSESVRGRGVGDALSRRCLDDMTAQGLQTADIAWAAESAIPFYSSTVAARLSRCFWGLRKEV